MQTKCDVCKKDCACKGCTKNNTCKYVSNDQCKVVVTCGMRKSWADDIMKKIYGKGVIVWHTKIVKGMLTQLPGLQWQQQPKKNRTLKN